MKRTPHFEVYPASDGFRWRLKSANGNIIADSGEAYMRKSGAVRAVTRIKQIMAQSPEVKHLSTT